MSGRTLIRPAWAETYASVNMVFSDQRCLRNMAWPREATNGEPFFRALLASAGLPTWFDVREHIGTWPFSIEIRDTSIYVGVHALVSVFYRWHPGKNCSMSVNCYNTVPYQGWCNLGPMSLEQFRELLVSQLGKRIHWDAVVCGRWTNPAKIR